MRRVLVVEDSRTQAERLRLVLTREGYEVSVATNGQEGLLATQSTPFELILSDVTMPVMDGLEFCRAVKSSPATRTIPLILLTARASLSDIADGLEAGADNFIPKPYEDSFLLERIAKILQRRDQNSASGQENSCTADAGETVTADRRQIVELLQATFDDLSRAHEELVRSTREVEEARREAERANQYKTLFLSQISHELRTPLNSILGFAQILKSDAVTPDQIEGADIILTVGRHLLELINELLDIGRIEANQLTLSMEVIEVAVLLEECLTIIGPQAIARHIEVSNECETETYAHADRQRLRQVMLNLLSNAIKYNIEDGKLLVTAMTDPEGKVRISVVDTGRGLSGDALKNLFTPFERLGAEASDIEGTGLGLALTAALIKAMGGVIGVESVVGEGSTFWFELAATDSPVADAIEGQE